MCRTMNSLRSLLLGLYGIENVHEIAGHSFPKIQSRPTHHDPMIDGVTSNAEEKATHRKFIFKEHSLPHGFVDFKSVNEKLKRCLGYPDRVNYHVIRENLVCNKSHGLALPEGLDDDDIAQQVCRADESLLLFHLCRIMNIHSSRVASARFHSISILILITTITFIKYILTHVNLFQQVDI